MLVTVRGKFLGYSNWKGLDGKVTDVAQVLVRDADGTHQIVDVAVDKKNGTQPDTPIEVEADVFAFVAKTGRRAGQAGLMIRAEGV